MISFAKLPLYISSKIQDELKNFSRDWKPHFNTANYRGGWTVLPLRSPGGKNQIIPDLMTNDTYSDTAVMAHFPSVKKLLTDNFECEIMSVRFLNLMAGAEIKPHRDNELAFEMGEARLHFPVITNAGVEFYVENERIRMNEGECWYINANLSHRVANKGITDRIHLVIDCKVNEWLKKVFAKAEVILRNSEEERTRKKQIIEALREQNTPAAILIANKLEKELEP